MRFCFVCILALCAASAASPLAAQQPVQVVQPPGTVQPTGVPYRTAIGLDRTPLDLPAFRLQPIDALFVSRPFATWLDEWTRRLRSQIAAGEQAMVQRFRFLTPQQLAAMQEAAEVERAERAQFAQERERDDSMSFLPPLVPRRRPSEGGLLSGVVGDNATLGLQVRGMGNLGGAWTRFNPCDPSVQFTCRPGMFPELKPDIEFAIRAAGTISERVHIDVDYDQTREFDAANNINIYYQGLQDEILQRVEFGDVSIRLPGSSYLTRGVPAGNFGVMAAAQVGPLEVQAVLAQQKGDVNTKEFRLNTGGQAGVEQDAELVIDDADYATGQFFFIVPPSELGGAPHIDALRLTGIDAPASLRPGIGTGIQVFRDERLGGQTAGQPGFFLAEAVPPTGTERHSGLFRRMIQEQDYFIHSSGLWIMLRSPLRPDEALAVAFVSETGDTIGMIDPESAPAGVTPVLRLLRAPAALHQPGSGTWPMEMHNVYRLDSSGDVNVDQIDLTISLGSMAGGQTFRDVLGQRVPLLRFFGLDEDAPVDRIDAAQVFQPARDGFNASIGSPISGTFVVFPTLRPFAQPARVESAGLSEADVQLALGTDANEAIYEEVDPISRASSARFQLNFRYRVKLDGLVSSFSLGAFGLRENSERLYLGSRLLERNVDYTIDYEIGTVSLNDAQNLFATSPGADLRATWEQKPLFSIAPTSVFGASARYSLGNRGELNFVGLYQSEQALMSRPQLGVEPGTAFLGGVSGRFDFGGALLDRMVGAIPGMRSTRQSAMTLSGEVAFSMPNPNRNGLAYLDDFEGTEELPLGLRRQDWNLGSAPQSAQGDRGTLPLAIDAASAVPIVWQHDFFQDGAVRGALLPSAQIDRGINMVGTERPEQVMWLTFGRGPDSPSPLPPPVDNRRWRSITTVLSTTGRDMSRSEYLEFYVSAGTQEPLALIFDVGTVSEDAFHVDSLGNTIGTYDDGRPWGLGRLDEEASTIDREVWGADRDRLGLWNQPCTVEPHVVYPLTDPRANCTRGNGLADTEDLNGNGILDGADAQYFRYVVQLDQLSEYLVRDTAATGTGFRLYRIPLRSGESVNGASDATWRFIRHLRMTIVGEPQGIRLMSIARMRIIGSRWAKRDVHGVQLGNLEDEPGIGAALADVRVGPVSAVTDGAVYSGPPGVGERAQNRDQQFDRSGVEINEKSLRLAYTDLQGGDRAEVYYRYPQQPRNMLTYRELRLWVLPREGNWGPDGTERFSIRIGADSRNYYLYQSKLRPPTGTRPAATSDWVPEIVIDFQQWFDLKAEAEQLLIERGPRPSGVDTVWSADSAYAIVLEDRARAPNLAAVREIVFAVYNGALTPATGEIWIDDLRVGIPDRESGAAGNIALNMNAGDLISANVTLSNQGPSFRQMNENPSYVSSRIASFSADARLDRLLPASWGLDLPLSVSHSTSAQTPTFLAQSDVEARQLEGLRETGTDATRVGLRIAKRTPSANPLLGLLVDGTALRLSYTTSESRNITSTSQNSGMSGDLTWRRDIAPRSFRAVPGFIRGALDAIAPSRLERSPAFRQLTGARLRWTPVSISFGTAYNNQIMRSFRYDRILALPGDTSVIGIESPRQGLRNDAQIALRPFGPIDLAFNMGSERDLLTPGRATNQRFEADAMRRALWSPGGFDLGWERARSLSTTFGFRPDLTTWLRAEYTWSGRYITDRSPSYLTLEVAGVDTSAQMQRRFESLRQTGRRITIQPPRILTALDIDTSSITARLLRRVDVIDLTWRGTLSSQFDRKDFLPGLGYQLGFGDLDSYSVMGADTATRAQQRDEFRFSTGIALIRAFRVDFAYHQATTESFDARGGRYTQTEVGWPRITLNWRPQQIDRRLSRFLTSFSTTGGVEKVGRSTIYSASAKQRRGATELRFPFSLSVGLPRAFLASYRGSYSIGETLDPTGGAENGGLQHDVSISAMLPPGPLRSRVSGPIAATLTYSQQGQRQCRYTTVTEFDGCIAFLDYGTRSLNMLLEASVRELRIGMQAQYVGRENRVGMRNTSSQFQLGFYGRFSLTAGQMPERFR